MEAARKKCFCIHQALCNMLISVVAHQDKCQHINKQLITVLMQLSLQPEPPSPAAGRRCSGGDRGEALRAISNGSEKYKIESMINFSISLCGYLIIVPIDSRGLLLNINMQKKS